MSEKAISQDTYTYLALGDSYTIGEAVDKSERWPVQLSNRLVKDGINISKPKIIATTGWTTDELIEAIDKESIKDDFSLVSLLIGVNNQYRGYPIKQYKKEFEDLLTLAIGFASNKPENVFVLSIPDYGVTPFSESKKLDANKIAKELDDYNAIAKKICKDNGVPFVDITPGSKKARNDRSLIASDGLHPSGIMYSQWVEAAYNLVYDNLSTR